MKTIPEKTNIRMHLSVSGIVQGVGFRPFLYKEVTAAGLTGWIRNDSDGVEMELEGEQTVLERFVGDFSAHIPRMARIDRLQTERMDAPAEYADFRILPSQAYAHRHALVSPDLCVCEDCLAELADPSDRRYGYPFINCTNCGPRFTIVRDVPYDRRNTTMRAFPMCPSCAAEFEDVASRRFHAQPDCCPDCGPHLIYQAALPAGLAAGKTDQHPDDAEAVRRAAADLRDGKIVAVKGLGGIHLACRADDPPLIRQLRQRKQRDRKPFALMCANLAEAAKYCVISDAEASWLSSPARPIVLLKKKVPGSFPELSRNGYLGIMLPYAPLHFLLFAAGAPGSLVMTSANLSDRPILYTNEQALQELSGIADAFLLHNRDIHVRCDDSLMWIVDDEPYFVRRSRGFVPSPLPLFAPGSAQTENGRASGQKKQAEEAAGFCVPVLACGAEQKATFSLAKGERVFPCQHIGDLKNAETLENYEQQIRHFEKLFDIRPEKLVCDLHPDYLSTRYAEERAEQESLPLIRIQHHWAHMASCMADNGLDKPCIGIIWDGTGYGTDGTIWGGEFLIGDLKGFERRGTILPMPLAGGDTAIHEIWRIGLGLLGMFRRGLHGTVENSPESAGQASEKDSACITAGQAMQVNSACTAAEQCFLSRLEKEGVPPAKCRAVQRMLDADLNCPATTSIGRLFDGVSALLGICTEASYEGEGAILLETAAEAYPDENRAYTWRILDIEGSPAAAAEKAAFFRNSMSAPEEAENGWLSVWDYRPMLTEAMADFAAGTEPGRIAARFLNTLTEMAAETACRIRAKTGLSTVVLSGGVFQNQILLAGISRRLREEGFAVCRHRLVSANDEGISLGQLMIAGRM